MIGMISNGTKNRSTFPPEASVKKTLLLKRFKLKRALEEHTTINPVTRYACDFMWQYHRRKKAKHTGYLTRLS